MQETERMASIYRVTERNLYNIIRSIENMMPLSQISQEKKRNKYCVTDILRYIIVKLRSINNKDILNFLQIIKKNISGVMALKIPDEKNSYTTKEINKVCKKLDIVCVEKKNIKLCNQFLLSKIKPEQILVTGSLYFIGKIRKLFI